MSDYYVPVYGQHLTAGLPIIDCNGNHATITAVHPGESDGAVFVEVAAEFWAWANPTTIRSGDTLDVLASRAPKAGVAGPGGYRP